MGASTTFEDAIIYNAQRHSELETMIMNKFKHSSYYASSRYLQVLKRFE